MQSWFAYSLAAAVFLAANFLLVKKAALTALPVESFSFYMWLVAAAGLATFMFAAKKSFSLSAEQGIVVAAAGLTLLVGMVLLNRAIYVAPNPGFATAVGTIQVLIVVFMSALLFGSELTSLKVAGAALVVGGVILLGL